MERDPLEVDPETMRLLGYQVVDWLVDRSPRPARRAGAAAGFLG